MAEELSIENEADFVKKRVLAAVSALIMAFACMTACGNSSSISDVKSSSTPDSSLSVPESTADSDSKTETTTIETTTTTTTSSANDSSKATPNDGKYTYTVYGDIQLTMDVNIDDYITTNKEEVQIFHLTQLAIDLGWLPEDKDPAEFGGTETGFYDKYSANPSGFYYHRDSGEKYHIAIDPLYGSKSKNGTAMIGYLGCGLMSSSAKDSISIHFSNHSNDTQYLTPHYSSVTIQRDDVIIIAYLLSNARNCGSVEKNLFTSTGLERYKNNGYRLP
ncbi:MAG: hypothetical protein ILA17_02820 [Ruminococcus sp.]|nr:hypothetical protein [Ruminococcus sp.]